LCALLLSYAGISKEREQGTLRLILAHPVPRSAVFWGKFFRGATLILLSLLVAFLFCMIILNFIADLGLERVIILGVIAGASFLYGMVFYAAGLVISIFVRSSRLGVVVAILSWICFVFVIPATVPMMADAVEPIPTRADLAIQQNEVRNRHLGPEQMRKVFEERSLRFGDARSRAVTEINQVTDDYLRKAQSQEEVAATLARSSPTGCYALALTYLTGTSLDDQHRYLNNVRAGIRGIVLAQTDRPLPGAYSSPSAGERIQAASTDIALLMLYLIALALIGHIGLLYYDPR
jgi:ABC-type transport system involved in multi-copper enzyme maturation permease subunit